MSNKYQPVPENMQQDPDGLWRAAVPSPTENTEELEKDLLVDPVFQHILKFAPQSQRELMTFELAKYFASREHQAVQAFGEKVLAHEICQYPNIQRQDLEAVITSLMKVDMK